MSLSDKLLVMHTGTDNHLTVTNIAWLLMIQGKKLKTTAGSDGEEGGYVSEEEEEGEVRLDEQGNVIENPASPEQVRGVFRKVNMF